MIAQHSRTLWRWFFAVAIVEAAAAMALLMILPRESSGISLSRAAVLAMLAACLVLGIAFAIHPPNRIIRPVRGSVIVLAGLLSLALAVGLFLLRYLNPELLLPYYTRLSVPLWFLLALGTQTALMLVIQRQGFHGQAAVAHKESYGPAGLAFAALLAALLLVVITRMGVTPDSAYWGEPGVPILGWQLALSMLGGLGVMLIGLRVGSSSRLMPFVATAIWLLACAIWLSVPTSVLHNSFYAPIRPPTGQAFPNSDAGYYDSMAHSLLIGYPYQGEIPSRPLYIVLLGAFHALLGERYDLIAAGQTLILAFIPAMLFALGYALHSPAAGAIAALAAIGREWTSLLVSSMTRVSNSRMLLVDLPTLLVLLVCCVFTVRWLQGKDVRNGTIAGGTFGLLLLLRTQVVIILPVILLLGLLGLGPRSRATWTRVALFVAAAVITIAPWLIHNYALTGELSLDAPFQYRIIASQYRYTGNLDIDNVDLEGRSLLGVLATFAIRDPGFVFGFVANHALATQVGGVLALPLLHDYRGLAADVNLYWVNWDGSLGPANMVLVAIYLGLMAIGLGSAWRRVRWAGLVPLAFSLSYSAANGIARFSGWRYDLPADWIAYFYLALGAADLLILLAALLGAERKVLLSPEALEVPPTHRPKAIIPVLMTFLALGLLPWAAQFVAAPRYIGATRGELTRQLLAAPGVRALGIEAEQVEAAAAYPGAVVETGRVLYPRFFSRGNGLASAHPWPAFAPRDYPRLGFLLINDSLQDVIMPTRDLPQGFDHAADAVVLGCVIEDHVEAKLVLFPGSGLVFQGAPLVSACQ